jgi:hypothetical protein
LGQRWRSLFLLFTESIAMPALTEHQWGGAPGDAEVEKSKEVAYSPDGIEEVARSLCGRPIQSLLEGAPSQRALIGSDACSDWALKGKPLGPFSYGLGLRHRKRGMFGVASTHWALKGKPLGASSFLLGFMRRIQTPA